MEEVNRRSLAGETKTQHNRPQVQKQPSPIVFPCMDVRYKNKPIQGYTVFPEDENGTDAQPPTGTPLLEPGSVAPVEPPSVATRTVPGMTQMPTAPPPPTIPSHPQSQRCSPKLVEGPSQHHHHLDNNNDPPGTQQRTVFDQAGVVAVQRDYEARDDPRPVSPLLSCLEVSSSTLPVEQERSSAINSSYKPPWYDQSCDSFRGSKSEPRLLLDIARCEQDLTWSLQGPDLIHRFQRIQKNR